MAVILRNGASRAARNTPSSTIPIRSSKITVAQTGLISSLTGANNQSINAINLGYQGDNEVSCIQVKLWETAQNLTLNYEAWIVFYHENSASSTTLTLSADGNDGEYTLLVPESITSRPGNYQLYVVLNERTGYSEGGSGGVGPADDPAYRETFVSAGCKAVVNDKSGYSLLTDFDWANVYNYDKGVITIDDKEWTLTEDGKYSTSIYLGGLDLDKLNNREVIVAIKEIINTNFFLCLKSFCSKIQYLVALGIQITNGIKGPQMQFCNPCPDSCSFVLSQAPSSHKKKHPNSTPPQFLPISL